MGLSMLVLGIRVHDWLHLQSLFVNRGRVLELAVWLALLLGLEHLPVQKSGETAAHEWTNYKKKRERADQTKKPKGGR